MRGHAIAMAGVAWRAAGIRVQAYQALVMIFATVGGLGAAFGQQLSKADWQKLGELPAGGGLETGTIRVGNDRGHFERLRITSEGGDLQVHELRVYFVGGHMQRLLQQERIGRQSDGVVATLEAPPAPIDHIEITFKGRGAASRGTILAVWAEPARSMPEAPAVAAQGWHLLGKETVPVSLGHIIIPVGRQAGRFEAIQIAVTSSDVAFHDIRVVYLDGEVDTLAVRRLIRAGDASPPLPLQGGARFIREIELVQEADPNAKLPGQVQVLARRSQMVN